jgi:transposase-like protein
MEECGHIPVWGGQRVERTNVRGRHSYCAAFKAWMIEQAMRPQMSMAGLAMRNQVNANQLRRWVKLHRQGARGAATTAARLLPVTIAVPAPAVPAAACPDRAAPTIEIELAGAVVRVSAGVDAQQLRVVLQALRA